MIPEPYNNTEKGPQRKERRLCDICGSNQSKLKWTGPAEAAIQMCVDEEGCDERARAYWDAQ